MLLFIVSTGCGGDDDGNDGDASSSGEQVPPAWVDAPELPLQLGQGQSRHLPMTLTGVSGVTAAATSPPELEAEVTTTEPPELAVHASYQASGTQTLQVDVSDDKGLRVGYAVGVDVFEIGWRDGPSWSGSSGPEAREHGALLVDDEGAQVFLIGGSGYQPYGTPLDDVWRYDLAGAAWAEVTPTGDVPDGAGSRRVAQVDSTTAYLFGGYGKNSAVNAELYRVRVEDGTLSFQLLDMQTNPPPARALHAFVYDATSNRFVLFGGAGAAKPFSDTWVMTLDGDVATWTEVMPAAAPSARYGFFYGFDAERGRLVVFSGAQGFASINPAQDTWALDVRAEPPAWELVHEGDPAVPGRRNGCMVWDPTGPRLFVFGGTADGMTTEAGVFAFDARPGKARWDLVERPGEPPLRSSGIGFHHASRQDNYFGFGNTTSDVYADWFVLGYPVQ